MEPGILAGIGSAAAFGIGDFSGGYAARRTPSFIVAAGAQVVGLLLLLAALLVLAPGAPDQRALGYGALSGVFGGLGLVALYRGLSQGSMGLVTALSGAGSVAIPVLLGVLLLGNPLTQGQWLGVAAAALAAVLATGATLQGVSRDAVLMGALAAIGFGLWFVFLDQGAEAGEVWTLVASRTSATLLVGSLALLLPQSRRALSSGQAGLVRALPFVAVAGAMDVTGNGAFVLAAAALPVGVAAALAGLYPLVTMGLARLFLRDALPPLGLAAVAVAVGGIVLISSG
jgi:drug/metabolite transporter (DMT)-like permease